MNRPNINGKDIIPKISFPGISQSDFEDAFNVLNEALVVADSENPVYGFIYPFCGPGGEYGECWWQLDTSLALCGAKWVNQEFAENVLRGFIGVQRESGRIPLHGPDVLLNSDNLCSSVPKLFQVGYEVCKRTKDRELVKEIYIFLKKYLDWWLSARKDPETGLITALVEESLPGRNIPLMAVETNVEVMVGYNVVSKLAKQLGYEEDYKKYSKGERSLCCSINNFLWDESKSAYISYDPQTKNFDGKMYSTTFDTLKLRIAPEERVTKLLRSLTDNDLFQWDTVPLTSTCKKDKCYNETPGRYAAMQWEGSIWSLRNYSVIEGLDDIGRYDLSAHLELKTVQLFNNNYTEFLNPPDGSGQGVLRYSWSASQYVQILVERIFGVDYDGFKNVLEIRPNIHPSLYGEELKLEKLKLPNGSLLNLSVVAEADSVCVTYNIEKDEKMNHMGLYVSAPYCNRIDNKEKYCDVVRLIRFKD